MNPLRFGRGRERRPTDNLRLHPLMQAHLQMDLPFTVATDHAIWGTFSEFHPAVVHADQIAPVEPHGERIMVLLHGKVVYAISGTGPITVEAHR